MNPLNENEESRQVCHGFEGIWIPRNVWLSSLSWTEKGLIAQIKSLAASKEGCFAKNKYFSDFLGVSEHQVTVLLSRLKKMGVIQLQSFNGRSRYLTADVSKIEEKQTLSLDKCAKDKGRPYPEIRADPISGCVQIPVKPLRDNGLNAPKANYKINLKENPNLSKIEHFVKKFYAIQRERFPTIVKHTPASQIAQACDTIDKLVRIDGYTLPQVIRAITWALDDDFWAPNIHSIVGLRSQSKKNDLSKFQNILSGMERDNNKQSIKGSPSVQQGSGDLDIGTIGRNYRGLGKELIDEDFEG